MLILLIIAGLICYSIWPDFLWSIIGLFILVSFIFTFMSFILKIIAVIVVLYGAVKYYRKRKVRYIEKELSKIAKDSIHTFKTSHIYNENLYRQPLETIFEDYNTMENYEQPKEHYLKLEDKVRFYQDAMEKIYEMDADSIHFDLGLMSYIDLQNDRMLGDVLKQELSQQFGYATGHYLYGGEHEKWDFINKKNDVLEEYKKEFFINKNGVTGEKRVNDELRMYSQGFINLENIRLVVDGESVETDNIVISEYGIFSIEVKNFSESGSYSLKITKDGQWLKVFNNGEMKAMKDVWSQVNRHLFYKQRFLEQQVPKEMGISKDGMCIHPIVVIANDQIIIDNQSDLPVFRASQIYRYMTNRKGNLLKPEEITYLTELFKKHTKESKSYPVLDYVPDLNTRYEKIKLIRDYINSLAPISHTYYESILKNKRLKFALNIKDFGYDEQVELED